MACDWNTDIARFDCTAGAGLGTKSADVLMMATNNPDEFTGRMFEAINGMLLDMLAAVARRSSVAGKRRAKPRPKPRLKATILAGRKTSSATRASLACSQLVSHGERYRTQRTNRATIATIARRNAAA